MSRCWTGSTIAATSASRLTCWVSACSTSSRTTSTIPTLSSRSATLLTRSSRPSDVSLLFPLSLSLSFFLSISCWCVLYHTSVSFSEFQGFQNHMQHFWLVAHCYDINWGNVVCCSDVVQNHNYSSLISHSIFLLQISLATASHYHHPTSFFQFCLLLLPCLCYLPSMFPPPICPLSLSDLHRTRLTHTDLKPENILFVSSDFDIYYDARKVRAK